MIRALLTFFAVGLAAVVGIGLVLAIAGIVFGIVFGVAGFLLFKVAPIVLIGYLIVRFLAPRKERLAPAESTGWSDEA